MNHRGTVQLETPRLILRAFTVEDVPAAFRNWMGNDAVTRYLRWPTYSDVSVTERIVGGWVEDYKNADFYQWTIVPRELGEPIGTISVVEMDERTSKVHIAIASAAAGGGRATPARPSRR